MQLWIAENVSWLNQISVWRISYKKYSVWRVSYNNGL